jgi:hypothetical protein
MRALVLTLMCIAACQAAISATVYKWVDADGVTHYTDQPHPGAQKLQLQSAQTYSAAAAQRGSSGAAAQGARRTTTSAPVYSACEVRRPANDEVFVNTSSVPAMVHVEPGLRGGDRLTVMLDGAPLPVNTPLDTEFVVSSVVRGTHALTTKVEDASGAVVCQSASVIFHVRQPSLLAPNQANRPH